MPDMSDPDVCHVVLLPQRARHVPVVHDDAVEHQQHQRHPVPAVPDVDDAAREHVGHGHQTDRSVAVDEGGVLQLVVRMPRAGARAVCQRTRIGVPVLAERAMPGGRVPVGGNVRTTV